MAKIALLEDSAEDKGYRKLLGFIAKEFDCELIFFDLSKTCLRKSLDAVLLEKPDAVIIDIKYNNTLVSQYLRKTTNLFYKPYDTSLLVDYLAIKKKIAILEKK